MTRDEVATVEFERQRANATISGLINRAQRAENQRDDLIEAIESALGSLYALGPMAARSRRILEGALGDLGRR